MGSAGHSGCVARRGVRRDPAQWAGPIFTRERVFLWSLSGEGAVGQVSGGMPFEP